MELKFIAIPPALRGAGSSRRHIVDTLFRIATDRYEISLQGTEEFVRSGMARFLPHLGTKPNGGAEAPVGPSPDSLAGWYAANVPSGRSLTMQDAILAFGYFLKRVRNQHLFTPSDVKRAFREVDRRIPKSLLQIMGTLKRDHGLLWSPEDRRGQYALTPTGIRHIERLLGIQKKEPEEASAAAPSAPAPAASGAAPNGLGGERREESSSPSSQRFESLFRSEEGEDR